MRRRSKKTEQALNHCRVGLIAHVDAGSETVIIVDKLDSESPVEVFVRSLSLGFGHVILRGYNFSSYVYTTSVQRSIQQAEPNSPTADTPETLAQSINSTATPNEVPPLPPRGSGLVVKSGDHHIRASAQTMESEQGHEPVSTRIAPVDCIEYNAQVVFIEQPPHARHLAGCGFNPFDAEAELHSEPDAVQRLQRGERHMANAAEQPNVIRRIFHLLDRAPGLIPSSDPAAQARLCIEIAEREESLAELCLTELRHGSSVEPEPVEDMFNELVATALRTRLLTTGDTESVAEIIEHAASDLWPDGFPLELQQMYYPVAATHLRQALLDTADKGGTESPFWGVVESLGGMRAVLDRERVWQTLAAEGETQSRIIALHFYAWRDAETIAELLSLELAAVERYLRDADLLLEALRDDEETDSVE